MSHYPPSRGEMAPIVLNSQRCQMTDVQRKTLSVPEAGRDYFELGRNASYEAAKRGEIPIIKVGRKLRVPIVALEAMLNAAGQQAA